MPIQCSFDIEEISKSRFHEIDYRVMRHVFDIQNELGRLCYEAIYQSELAHRCRSEGFTIDSGSWEAGIPSSEKLRENVVNLLSDWGAFLDVNLYREAIFYFISEAIGSDSESYQFKTNAVGELLS